MTKKGEKIKLNFEDTTPLLRDKPLNSYFQGIIGRAMVYFCGWFFMIFPPTMVFWKPSNGNSLMTR